MKMEKTDIIDSPVVATRDDASGQSVIDFANSRYCPRNWPRWWKYLILFNVSLYNFMGNVFASGAPPIQRPMIATLHINKALAANISTFALLTIGLSNLWAVPATRLIGKRYTIIGSLVVFTVANIWTAVAGTYGSVMGSRIVGGMFGGVIESLGPPIVEELFDRRELGRAMQIYVMGLGLGSVMGPMMAGFITHSTNNWRNFFWLSAGMIALNLVMSIFMLPETSYPATSGERSTSSTEGSASSIDQHQFSKGNIEEGGQEVEEVRYPVTDQNQPSWMQVWMKNSFFMSHPHIHHPKSWLLLTFDPFRLLLVPAVAGVCLLFGTHIAWAVTVSVNVANHYGGPPFLWPTSHLGLINLAPFTGLILGFFFGGIGADFLANRAARKAIKNRTHDDMLDASGNKIMVHGGPEARLAIIIVAAIVSPLGNVLTGVFLGKEDPWIDVTVAMAMGAFGITAACNVYLTYCIDAYKPYAAQLSVTINVFKNALGFAASYASVAWYEKVGYLNMFGTMGGILWLVYFLIVPIYLYGKGIRAWTYRWLATKWE